MCEIQADRGFRLDLVDAFDLVFDRILDSDDLHVRCIELAQRGVQRGGLARAGRTGDQQDSVRLFEHLLELRQEFVGEAELVEVEHDGFAIQQAHHHRFAMRGWNSAHAQVEFLALHAQHDAAVLRQTPFRDVELGHDLDARDHRCGQVRRRRFDFLEHAVHAQSHLQPILERLDVDVGRARFDRALDDQIHQPDDRRFGGEIAQVFDIVGIGHGGLVADVLHDCAHRAAATPVVALDQIGDFRTQTDFQAHRASAGQRDCFGWIGVLRIGDQQVDGVLVLADRTHCVLFQEAWRDLQRRWRIRAIAGGDQWQVQHFGAGLGHVAFRDHAQLAQQRRQMAAGFLLQPAHAREIDFLEPAAHDQCLDDAIIEAVLVGIREWTVADWIRYRCVHALRPLDGGCTLPQPATHALTFSKMTA